MEKLLDSGADIDAFALVSTAVRTVVSRRYTLQLCLTC
jgi:hypothetical protein